MLPEDYVRVQNRHKTTVWAPLPLERTAEPIMHLCEQAHMAVGLPARRTALGMRGARIARRGCTSKYRVESASA